MDDKDMDKIKIRTTIYFPKSTQERIDRLLQLTEAPTVSAIIRQSLHLHEVILSFADKNGTVRIQKADGSIIELHCLGA